MKMGIAAVRAVGTLLVDNYLHTIPVGPVMGRCVTIEPFQVLIG